MALRRSIRWPLVAIGAGAFVGAHLVLVFMWPLFEPGAPHRPWFLNSGRAVAFTAAWLLAAGSIAGATAPADHRGESVTAGASLAAGAVAAMIVVLMVIGPGNLFPIALVLGGLIVSAAVLAGALAGERLRR